MPVTTPGTPPAAAAPRTRPADPYGLASAEMLTDPHPLYHLLRYAEPVHWSEVLNAWVLTRYADVHAALRDPRLSSAMRRPVVTAQFPPGMRAGMAEVDRFLSRWVLNLDGEEHHRLRRILSRPFSARAIAEMRPRLDRLAAELLDEVEPRGEMDFLAEYARLLPVRATSEILGVPRDAEPLLEAWSHAIAVFFSRGPARPGVLDGMVRALAEMTEYLRGVVADLLRAGSDAMLAALARPEPEGGYGLAEDELVASGLVLLVAGHSTTSLMGNGMLLLFQHPGERARLRADPGLIVTAIDEFLRYESPMMRHDRVALEDLDLHGFPVRRWDRLVLVLGAANRDPERFPDPDRLDVGRADARQHTTFGGGPHACLGASLAVTQAQGAIAQALERFPRLRPAGPHRWREHFNFRGLESLPVRWD